jgi:glycosyltransferase involved in cell wall biosynthesis
VRPARTVLVQVNSLELGGTQLNAIDLATAVEPYGFSSVLFGPLESMPSSGPSALEVAGDRGVRMSGYRRTIGGVQRRAKALEQRAASIAADLVHVYGAWADPRSAYWGPCRGGRRPFVHTVYEMSVDPGLFRHTSLIVGTGYLRDELALRPGPTTLISPPVDLANDAPNDRLASLFRRQLGEIGSRSLIVIVSRLDLAMKSYPVETAIRAMPELAREDVALVVVGTGSEATRLGELGEQANEAAGRQLVRFVGAMSDPRPAYAAADVVLGMGSSAARALAFGRPLIVQGELGTSELFEPSSAASLFRRSFWNPEPEPDAAPALARHLGELLGLPERRNELGAFGRSFAEASFGLDAMAQRLAAVYDQSFSRYGTLAWARDLDREARYLARWVRGKATTAIRPRERVGAAA